MDTFDLSNKQMVLYISCTLFSCIPQNCIQKCYYNCTKIS